MTKSVPVRVAVDIGGTFTDVVLEAGERRLTTKLLTTPAAPEEGFLAGLEIVLQQADLGFRDVSLLIHGTTLATNALIERRGAVTALITTQGFRDTLEIGTESRFEQYDILMDKPEPLVPRSLRMTVAERCDALGNVLLPLAPEEVERLIPDLVREGVTSVAVGFLHSYANPAHEQAVGAILKARLPEVGISLSCEVAPEMREYERISTACANAYVMPVMAGYLLRLRDALAARGCRAPLFLMLSGGGLCTVETAVRVPIRLVESGPAGGAIFASDLARRSGLDDVLSFDMGGTTAKICLVDDGVPQVARSFEVARVYRFLKGSGLPLRIPVIEMVEIGAGGGSIARVDALGRIVVGPQSAGARPGPACYDAGGTEATVTDADLVLGRIDPARFSGGRMHLDASAAARAVEAAVARPLGLSIELGAFGISEIVEEAMASAARVHAIESGKSLRDRTLIAFGGAAPLHAARLADKLEIDRVLIPVNAGVGSAVGFLRAPMAYEVVRSDVQRLDGFDPERAAAVIEAMRQEATEVVEAGAPGADRTETRSAHMRYIGQGHEITVATDGPLDATVLQEAFEQAYAALYHRAVPGVGIELLSWIVRVATQAVPPRPEPRESGIHEPADSHAVRRLFFGGDSLDVPVFDRDHLGSGSRVVGPAIIIEDETAILVTDAFEAAVRDDGSVLLERRPVGRL